MALASGTKFGPYVIVSALGAGGMGEVYRARDPRLNRDVAIKILPDLFATDSERVARFQREAQVLASLNHPNIAHVYGLEESHGSTSLVLELVEGSTLAERIDQGPLAIDDALPLARQIAEALEAAHEHGVVHRDLKPSNVMIRPDGAIKVLDFGLARVLEPELSPSSAPSTITSPAMTKAGVILGTAAYMSPEQARGLPADKRSDVWAFGCVLFEMLTGRRAFDGERVTDTLAAVLRGEPAWALLPAHTPPPVLRLLKRCLAKDVKRRLAEISSARLDLDDALSGGSQGDAARSDVTIQRRRDFLMAGVIAILLLATAALAVVAYRLRGSASTAAELRLEIGLPNGANGGDFALSPDGRQLLFAHPTQLWLRPLDSETPRPLAGTEDFDKFPFWSPDGRSIGFFTATQLKRIDLATGLARPLTASLQSLGGSWGSRGDIVFVPALSSSVMRVSDGGGAASAATRLLPGHVGHRFPYFLPDGRRFLFLVMGTPAVQGIYLGSLDAPNDMHRLMESDSPAVFAPPDTVLFMRKGTLMAQRLDVERPQLLGSAEPVAARVTAWSNQFNALLVSASASGALAYRTHIGERQLVWLDRAGREVRSVGSPDEAQQTGFTINSGRCRRTAASWSSSAP